MRILYLGDVVGRSGRTAVIERLGGLRARLQADFVVANCENATSGMGVSPKHAALLLKAGADALTLGDHAFDRRDMMSGIEREPRILRPLNFSRVAPGAGARVLDAGRGRKVLVAQVVGQIFMNRPYDNPFPAIDGLLDRFPLGVAVHATLVDIHCEATSEKMAMGHYCDGRASAVLGSHTHVPTADATILPGGTAYMTDAGMCGDYDSVIGMGKEEPLRRFVTGMKGGRFEAAQGEATLCGVLVTTDDGTGKALDVTPVRDGGTLAPRP